jgi:methionyl-tRNA formyltransferase
VRIAFFGTPDFAVPTLEALARVHDVALVVAQPDKPSGRGMRMHAPPVAEKARALGLPLAQPPKIRNAAFLDQIRAVAPDVGIVVAYGKILPAALLEIPRDGFLNVHASILPYYRGAAPIQRAIERGESETGVTIMRVDEQLDHGPMLAIERTPIAPGEHTPQLAARLSLLGADALVRALAERPIEIEQDHARATLAPKIDKSEGLVRWSDSASTIYNKFRAFDPWPGIFVDDLKLTDIAMEHRLQPAEAGTILSLDDDGVVVATSDGAIRLITVQRPGKSRVRASEHARAAGWRAGMTLERGDAAAALQ